MDQCRTMCAHTQYRFRFCIFEPVTSHQCHSIAIINFEMRNSLYLAFEIVSSTSATTENDGNFVFFYWIDVSWERKWFSIDFPKIKISSPNSVAKTYDWPAFLLWLKSFLPPSQKKREYNLLALKKLGSRNTLKFIKRTQNMNNLEKHSS